MSEEEKKTGFFSPQFDDYAHGSEAKFDHPGSSSSYNTISLVANPLNSGSSTSMGQPSSESFGTHSVKGENLPSNNHSGQQKISVADVTCPACKQLLFHPVVLNCGHGILRI